MSDAEQQALHDAGIIGDRPADVPRRLRNAAHTVAADLTPQPPPRPLNSHQLC